MEARSALRTSMPTDRETLLDQHATARTRLARERRIDRYDPPTGACCLVGEGAQERCPPCILDALGEMVVPDHIGDLQVLVINRVVGSDQCQRRLMMEVLPLAPHLLVRLRQQCDRLAASVAATLAPTHSALGSLERAFRFAIPTGGEDARAVGERGEGFRPIFDSTRKPLSSVAPLPYSMYVNECQRVRA
jgi:hypothetical protein